MQINEKIDKLTRSIENSISGDSFKTEVLPLTNTDVKLLKSKDWQFNWKDEHKNPQKKIFKLVINDNPLILQGLICLEDKNDHVFMHLIESAKFNRGKNKLYLGVPGNLVAFGCVFSFQKGYEGYVSFESKSKLIVHYQKSLGAQTLFGNFMMLDTKAALKLIAQYFPNFR